MEDVAPTAMRTPENENLNNNNDNFSAQNKNDIPEFIKKTDFKKVFQNKTYIISIYLTTDKKYLYIHANEENDNFYYFELKRTFDELFIFDKVFKICDNMEEAYSSMVIIFNNDKYYIKEINENKLFINISVLNLDGSYREKILELSKKLKNKDNLTENLYQKYLELKIDNIKLENELKNVKNENEKNEENFRKYKNEVMQEINELKNRIKNLESKSESFKSKIIKKKEDFDFVVERLKKVNFKENINHIQDENEKINIEFNLLYRATRDGDESRIFHLKCDNYKNTLVIVKTKKGIIFGGFTCETWNGNGIDKKDKNAFCFSLDKKKIYNSINGKNAIFACPDFGPAFENCIFEIKDKCFEYGGLCSDESQNYFDNHESICEINNGDEQFDVEDVEVFFVLFEKED